MRFIYVLAAGFAAFAQPSFADRWECNFKASRVTSWIPDAVLIQKNDGKYLVADPIILHFNKGLDEARLVINNARKRVFQWSVQANAGSQSANMVFVLTMRKDKDKATINAQPTGFPNSFRGTGKCVQKPVDPNLQKEILRALQEAAK